MKQYHMAGSSEPIQQAPRGGYGNLDGGGGTIQFLPFLPPLPRLPFLPRPPGLGSRSIISGQFPESLGGIQEEVIVNGYPMSQITGGKTTKLGAASLFIPLDTHEMPW